MTSEQQNHKKIGDFFREEYHALKGYVQSRIDDTAENDAEDILQDVAVKLFSRTDSTPIDNIAGFVYRSIRNKIIDIMRTKKEKIYDEITVEDLWTEFAALFYEPASFENAEHLKSRLKSAIGNLKPAYRDIIIAVDLEGLTYREIASKTGISQGTLMSQRHRALSLLAKQLELENTKA